MHALEPHGLSQTEVFAVGEKVVMVAMQTPAWTSESDLWSLCHTSYTFSQWLDAKTLDSSLPGMKRAEREAVRETTVAFHKLLLRAF